jgi:hypothetical protein
VLVYLDFTMISPTRRRSQRICAGNRTASAPKFSMVGAGRYVTALRLGGLGAQADVSCAGSHFFTPDRQQSGLARERILVAERRNFFEDKAERCTVLAWMKNAANENYFVSGLSNAGLGLMELFPGMPRTFGLSVTGRF